jgi:hypothetical protein
MLNSKDFLIVRMFGGLGNQLFQYSFGRSIALSQNKRLILDLSFYKNSLIDYSNNMIMRKSKYQLTNFNLDNDITLTKNCYKFSYRFFKYLLNYFPNYIKKKFFITKKFEIKNFYFEKNLFKIDNIKKNLNKQSCYYIGYWQSTEYFKKFEKNIKSELRLISVSSSAKKFIKKIDQNFVAIHIRGGDTLIDDNTVTPERKFYTKTIKLIKKKNGNIKFHIFTDDVEYSKKIIFSSNIKNFKIISSSKKFTDLEEFHILQNYKFVIISNSTFSWWAAYLNNIKKSKIYAPKIWYNQAFPKGLKIKNMSLI